MPEEPDLLTFASQRDWEAWLERHHGSSSGVWLAIAKKGSGERTVTQAEAVESGLCFGWIDSQGGRVDDRWFRQRMTPRGPRSRWSQINRKRAEALIAAGRMRPAGLEQVERAKRDGRWDAAYPSPSAATVPADLARALDAQPRARAFFDELDSTNRYAILYRVHEAKRQETRERRIARFVQMLAAHETIYPRPSGSRSKEAQVAEGALAKKLQIKAGTRVLVLGAPEGHLERLDPLPEGAEVKTRAGGRAAFDVVHVFVDDRKSLDRRWAAASAAARPGGILWVSYPKQTSGARSDLNRDVLREELASRGWEAVSQVAVDERWSALRFKAQPAG